MLSPHFESSRKAERFVTGEKDQEPISTKCEDFRVAETNALDGSGQPCAVREAVHSLGIRRVSQDALILA